MEQFIYFLRAGESGPIKIGITQNLLPRIATLQTSHYEKLNVLRIVRGELNDETHLLQKFKNHNIRGEWFWPTTDIISYIDELPSEIADNFNTIANGKCFCGNLILHIKFENNIFFGYCHTCLMEKDGRLEKLIETTKNQSIQEEKPCKICSKKELYLRKGRCAACAAYFRRTGLERQNNLITRPKTCINCGRFQKQLARKLCNKCYYQWKQGNLKVSL